MPWEDQSWNMLKEQWDYVETMRLALSEYYDEITEIKENDPKILELLKGDEDYCHLDDYPENKYFNEIFI